MFIRFTVKHPVATRWMTSFWRIEIVMITKFKIVQCVRTTKVVTFQLVRLLIKIKDISERKITVSYLHWPKFKMWQMAQNFVCPIITTIIIIIIAFQWEWVKRQFPPKMDPYRSIGNSLVSPEKNKKRIRDVTARKSFNNNLSNWDTEHLTKIIHSSSSSFLRWFFIWTNFENE